jgi:hypothetical protein
MRKTEFETRTHQERSKKIFSLLFIVSPAKYRQLYNKDTPIGI